MNNTKLTYRQLQSELKAYKLQGLTSIKLNSKYDVLLAEYERLTTVEIVEVQEVQEAKVADHLIYQDFGSCTLSQQKKFVNAINFRFKAYGMPQATGVQSVKYNPDFDLWQVQYYDSSFALQWETMYDSELVNALNQTPDVFEPTEQLFDVVSALREEFAGVQFIQQGNKYIIRFGSLALTFITRNNKLIWCDRRWDTGRQWVNEYVDKHYRTQNQVESLKAQLRSDFWFELEVVEVA